MPHTEIRIVEWPAIALLALCVLCLAAIAAGVWFRIEHAPRAAVPIETVTRELWRIEGRAVECLRREDHIQQTTTLSC